MNPKDLSNKIIAAILSTDPSKQVTYDMLIDRYSSRVESRGILDNAIVLVHKSKLITVRELKGVLIYSAKIKKQYITPDHVTWCKNNYPYPKDFVMPFPEWDVSYIFLNPDELKEYKEAAKGGRVYKRKRYQHVNAGR